VEFAPSQSCWCNRVALLMWRLLKQPPLPEDGLHTHSCTDCAKIAYSEFSDPKPSLGSGETL